MTAKNKAVPSAEPKKEDPKALNVAQQTAESPADALTHTCIAEKAHRCLTTWKACSPRGRTLERL